MYKHDKKVKVYPEYIFAEVNETQNNCHPHTGEKIVGTNRNRFKIKTFQKQ